MFRLMLRSYYFTVFNVCGSVWSKSVNKLLSNKELLEKRKLTRFHRLLTRTKRNAISSQKCLNPRNRHLLEAAKDVKIIAVSHKRLGDFEKQEGPIRLNQST